MLLGKTGAGKSSLANTLFGEKHTFKVSSSANSETKLCQSKIKQINGRSVQLTDTPGLINTATDGTELTPELLNCIVACAPGPHAFLIVMKVETFTEEQTVVDLILKNFSEEVLKYITVVFTHGDQLEDGQTIEMAVKENKALSDLVNSCGGRCHVFDNRYWNNSQDKYKNNKYQMEQLLKSIDQTVRKNERGYYTNELFQKVQENMKQTKQRSTTISMGISSVTEKTSDNKKIITAISIGSVTGGLVGAALGLTGIITGAAVGALLGSAGNWLITEFSQTRSNKNKD